MSVGRISWDSRTVRSLLWLFFAATTFATFVPLFPRFPEDGLDPSWQFALNQAVAQGLVFGQDVIFSFGPYAAVYNRVYHPATDGLMLLGALLFWAGYAGLCLLVTRRGGVVWPTLLAVFIAGAMYLPDPVLFSLPLLVALATYRITLPSDHPGGIPPAASRPRYLALIFAPLGLLPLIKGTALILAVAIAGLCSVMLARRRQRFLALSALGVPPLTALALWLIAGQPVAALPDYVVTMVSVISGYTEAMAVKGKASEVISYAVIAVLLLAYVVSATKGDPRDSRVFLLASCGLILFLAFKAGFVRHDSHAVIASTTIVVASVLLASLFPRWPAAGLVTLALLAWVYVDQGHVGSSAHSMVGRIGKTYGDVWLGLRERFLAGGNPLPARYGDALGKIRGRAPLPSLTGTTDIYAYQQSRLLASENSWAPRPVLQSYSAYTPRLARMVEAHFRTGRSPANMIFRVETIDGRYPTLDEGVIWPALIENYSVERVFADFAVLRKDRAAPASALGGAYYEAEHRIDEQVRLPRPDRPAYAELILKPTWLGRVRALFWKPPPLTLTVTLRDGTARTYRIVSGMTETGFILSPLIESTQDFARFATTGTRDMSDMLVTALMVRAGRNAGRFWQPIYTLRLRPLVVPQRKDGSTIWVSDNVVESHRFASLRRSTPECDGSIDAVNGAPPAARVLRARGVFTVEGWTAVAPRSGVAADEVFVTLRNKTGQRTYYSTRTTPRPDVKQYFGQPDMNDVGFTAQVDVSKLRGTQVLGISRRYQQSLEDCSQFRLTVEIGGQESLTR